MPIPCFEDKALDAPPKSLFFILFYFFLRVRGRGELEVEKIFKKGH